MDSRKSILLIVSFSCLLLSGDAVPSTRTLHVSVSPSEAPAQAANGNSNIGGSLSSTLSQNLRPDVEEFCKNAENPALCANTVSPHVKGAFDPIMALGVEMQATLGQSERVLSTITSLIDSAGNSKKLVDALEVCKEQYNNILFAIKDTDLALELQDLASAWINFGTVLTFHSTCEEAFSDAPGVEFPFAEESKAMYQLGSNCLATLATLNGQIY